MDDRAIDELVNKNTTLHSIEDLHGLAKEDPIVWAVMQKAQVLNLDDKATLLEMVFALAEARQLAMAEMGKALEDMRREKERIVCAQYARIVELEEKYEAP